MDAPIKVWNGNALIGVGLVPLHVCPSMAPLKVWKRAATRRGRASHRRGKKIRILFVPLKKRMNENYII